MSLFDKKSLDPKSDLAQAISGKEKIMSLGLYQPYASLMLHGKLETRNRKTNVRGWVLLYSTKKVAPGWLVTAISGIPIREKIDTILKDDKTKDLRGHAIALGYLSDCRPMERGDQGKAYVLYEKNKWIWEFQSIIPIVPFPYKGSQGWRTVTDGEKALIKSKPIPGWRQKVWDGLSQQDDSMSLDELLKSQRRDEMRGYGGYPSYLNGGEWESLRRQEQNV